MCVTYFPLFKSYVCEKHLNGKTTYWSLKDKSKFEANYVFLTDFYIDFIFGLKPGTVYGKKKTLS